MDNRSEAARLAALESYEILDTPREQEFDDVVGMAGHACGTPIAILNFIDRDRQWFKAEVGLGLRQMPFGSAICTAALAATDLLLVPDIAGDDRFADDPLVTGPPHARFFAGVPLKTAAGLPIGVLCVVDRIPREMDERQIFVLHALARSVMARLEPRRAAAGREAAIRNPQAPATVRDDGEVRSRHILASAIDYAIISFNLDGRITSWNEGARRIMGWAEAEMLGQPGDRFFTDEDVAAGVPAAGMANAIAQGRGTDERWHLRKGGERFWANGEMMALHDDAGATIGVVKILRDRTERRLSYERLERSQQRIAAALDTGLMGFFEWDVVGGILTGDGHFAQFYDIDVEQAKRGVFVTDVMARIHPDDLPDVQASIAAAVENAGDYAKSFRLFHRDGRMCWLMIRGRCVERNEAGPVKYAGVSIDVTDARMAEGRLRVLSGAAAALLGASDPHSVLQPLLKAAATEIGFDRSYSYELMPDGEHLALVQSMGTSEQECAALACTALDDTLCGLVVKSQEPLILTDVMRSVDPRLAPGRAAGLCAFAGYPVFADGELVGVQSFASTRLTAFGKETLAFFETIVRYLSVVRERGMRERELGVSEARYRALFDNIDAGFCVIDVAFDAGRTATDYRFVEVNPAFEAQTGLLGSEGKWMRDLAPAHEQHWFDMYGKVALTGEAVRFENEASALGRWYDVHAYRIDEPAAHRVAILFHDITIRKQTEEALRQLNETLESRVRERTEALLATEAQLRQSQKMEAVGQLTGGLAHDFNNLLTAVTGGLELLQVRVGQQRYDDLDRYIDMAQSGARRAASLTQRLLAFSRRQTLAPTVLDVDQMAAGMRDIIDRTLGPTIELTICTTDELWPVMVDAPQLENALLNLCINARDAMPDGGKLTIETANVSFDARAAASQELEAGDYVSLCVTDTGTGMPADVIAKVFDPFFTTKPLGQGTGLGLSMIYGFTRQSEGHVRVYSEVGHGTTVCLYLPRHRGSMPAQTAEGATQPVLGPKGREVVLVVEDEAPIRALIAEILGEIGYRVLLAEDGPSGVECLRAAGHIDLLVTDVGLPGGLNGRQVADAGRSLRPGLKTLFITGYAANAAVGAGHLEAGMEVLTKPFNTGDLARRVRAIIDGA